MSTRKRNAVMNNCALRAAFYRAEAFPEGSFNPEKIAPDKMLGASSLRDKPASSKQAEALYFQSLTNPKKCEYFRFIRSLMRLSSKKGTIFGDTLKERIDTLNELNVLHLKRRWATIKATGITPNIS